MMLVGVCGDSDVRKACEICLLDCCEATDGTVGVANAFYTNRTHMNNPTIMPVCIRNYCSISFCRSEVNPLPSIRWGRQCVSYDGTIAGLHNVYLDRGTLSQIECQGYGMILENVDNT